MVLLPFQTMNTTYKFRLYVETPDCQEKCSAFDVDAYVARDAGWEPYDLCSDAMTAAMADGVTSRGAERIDAEREKLAAEISRQLTAHIMNAIKARDLRNGYPQNTNVQRRSGDEPASPSVQQPTDQPPTPERSL
jgi:hypothetical protein